MRQSSLESVGYIDSTELTGHPRQDATVHPQFRNKHELDCGVMAYDESCEPKTTSANHPALLAGNSGKTESSRSREIVYIVTLGDPREF